MDHLSLLIVLFGIMTVLVFGNVVLRYGFNSGIVFSEEVPPSSCSCGGR